MKPNLTKIFKWTLTSLILGIVIGAVISYAASPSFTTYIMSGSMTETASYLIFKDGVTYYAKNGVTGEIVYSGTNESAIIETVLAVMTDGGEIFFTAATHSLTAPIIITVDGITLRGEGISTILKVADGVDLGTDGIIQIKASYVHIHDIYFDGNKANAISSIIQIYTDTQAAEYLRVVNCVLHQAYYDGIIAYRANGFGSGGYVISGNLIRQCGRNGIFFDNEGGGASRIVSNEIHGCYFGIRIGEVSQVIIANNNFWENYDGIYTYLWVNGEITGNEINDNYRHGISLDGIDAAVTNSSRNIVISGNHVLGNNVNTTDGINGYGIVLGYAGNVTIVGNNCDGIGSYGATQQWGIYEANGNWNIIVGNHAIHNSVAGIWQSGANTQVNLCYNDTTWIP